jgi:hypothetical protein
MNDSPPTQPTAVTPTYSRTIGKQQIIRAILLLVLIVAIVAGSLPSYLSNQWSWANFPSATNIKQVKSILGKGIQLPDWNTYLQQPTEVGSHRWSLQLIGKTPENPILIFLRPQTRSTRQTRSRLGRHPRSYPKICRQSRAMGRKFDIFTFKSKISRKIELI